MICNLELVKSTAFANQSTSHPQLTEGNTSVEAAGSMRGFVEVLVNASLSGCPAGDPWGVNPGLHALGCN